MEKVKLGISACLVGEKVRYDGGHRWDHFLTDTLGRYVEFVPVCPEVESGLPVPREAMRLVGEPALPRLLTVRTGLDHTARLVDWSQKRVEELAAQDLCGFIFKSKSPSSGLVRVKVYNDHGVPAPVGVGIFARIFTARFPLLPVTDEGRLHDPALRENFIESIFAYQRWRALVARDHGPGALVAFHTRHKLQLMAHSPKHYRDLGRLVAQAGTASPGAFYASYARLFMEALRLKATPKKNANVLQHLMGYFKKELSPDEKQELLEVIEAYRLEYVPLVVPITLINHYVRKYEQPYLKDQYYLHPHPLELRLRNHV